MFFEKTAILGVGLLGASLALALKKKGISATISGYGRTEENLRRALEKGIIDSYCLDPSEAVRGADLVVLATPVGTFLEVANIIKDAVDKDSIQTDVGSVKGSLVHELESILPRFVGAHPISGGERSGADNADDGLFDGVRCIITGTGQTDPMALGRIEELWRALGAKVERMDPALHDRIYALVSHLPHILAYSLVNTLDTIDGDYIKFAGQGFKDTTRIALSSPELWRDVCGLNRLNLLDSIKAFKKELERVETLIRESDLEGLESEFARARGLRKSIDQKD
ncbi:MAG: prephenate dehydrogenase/arogenate dehydrogenase family protein [Nitrospiraceae bacterium]|nr:prephenate dehydrogenase/arogenate dehydrogenase family protein [Nitrospiraceae bacterium]